MGVRHREATLYFIIIWVNLPKSQVGQNIECNRSSTGREPTPDRGQSKALLTIDECGYKSLETVLLIAICRPTGHLTQSKTLLTINECGYKSLETVFLITICRYTGDKWQSKSQFLMIFDLSSSIVLTFSFAAYPVWSHYPDSINPCHAENLYVLHSSPIFTLLA